MNKNNKDNGRPKKNSAGQNNNGRSTSRGAAIRAQRRASDDAHRIASQYLTAENNPSFNGQKQKNQSSPAKPRARIITADRPAVVRLYAPQDGPVTMRIV